MPFSRSALDLDAIVPTLYDPEEFAALYHTDKARAIALVAAMTEPQRVRRRWPIVPGWPTTGWRST